MNIINKMARVRGVALVAASALALAACTTATPYQPAARGSHVSGGYTDLQIEANRFRVTFSGNDLTSRETVETYLLYRAAELSLAKGFDWFQMAARDTEKKTSTYVNQPFGGFGGPFGGGAYGYWGPSWRYHGGGFGWRGWDPYWGDPFFGGSIDVQTVDRYEAMAEIVAGRGPKPADPRTFDAREVVANLQARIVVPQSK